MKHQFSHLKGSANNVREDTRGSRVGDEGGGGEGGGSSTNGPAVSTREFQELKQLLNESLAKSERLQASNVSLTEDMAVLQTMISFTTVLVNSAITVTVF